MRRTETTILNTTEEKENNQALKKTKKGKEKGGIGMKRSN